MPDLVFALFFLHLLKGPPLSCLFAMLLNSQPVSVPWLARITGYNSNRVRSSLSFLSQCGFVSRKNRYTWQLAEPVEHPISIPSAFLISSG